MVPHHHGLDLAHLLIRDLQSEREQRRRAPFLQDDQRGSGVLRYVEDVLAERAELRSRLPQAFAKVFLDVVLGELDVGRDRQGGRVMRDQRVQIRGNESAQALTIAHVGGESRGGQGKPDQ
jgi:hypothetical protein